MICACGVQDASKKSIVDAAREDARLFKIASELADEEERKRQWRVARGEVIQYSCSCCKMSVEPDLHLSCPICLLNRCLACSAKYRCMLLRLCTQRFCKLLVILGIL